MDFVPTLILLMTAAILLVGIAKKFNIPYPIALVLGGLVLGFTPGLKPLYIDPNLLLIIVLPPILLYAAFWTSWSEFKDNIKAIVSLALGLVFATTILIAFLFKWIFPEIDMALCFAFGAIVSPPDAVAATAILKRFSIRPRMIAILEGESLINDASALVLYKVAILALVTGHYHYGEATQTFVTIAIGGIFVGLVTGWILHRLSRDYLPPVVGVLFSFIIPYISYVIADKLGVSGVLAVVVNGLIGARLIITHESPVRRVLAYSAWEIFIILINCFVFVLIGSELQVITQSMGLESMAINAGYGVLIFLALLAIRFIWIFSYVSISNYFEPNPWIFRSAAVVSWSGMRGIVSLAAALAIPVLMRDGTPVEGREIVIFITFVVILLTLLIPGLTLPWIIQALGLNHNPMNFCAEDLRTWLSQTAHDEINRMKEEEELDEEQHGFLINYFTTRHRMLEIAHFKEEKSYRIEIARMKVIQAQRHHLLQKWKDGLLDEKVLRMLERELDLEEAYAARVEV